MKKGEIYEGVIEKVDFPNKGYVFVEDQKVLIKNGIPGQKVRFMIQNATFRKGTGTLSWRVLEKSPLETREPVCSNFPACGGCMYQTMSYENQLHMKETQIRSFWKLHWSRAVRWMRMEMQILNGKDPRKSDRIRIPQ